MSPSQVDTNRPVVQDPCAKRDRSGVGGPQSQARSAVGSSRRPAPRATVLCTALLLLFIGSTKVITQDTTRGVEDRTQAYMEVTSVGLALLLVTIDARRRRIRWRIDNAFRCWILFGILGLFSALNSWYPL